MAFNAKKYWDLKKRELFKKSEFRTNIALSRFNNDVSAFDMRQTLKNKFSKTFKRNSSLCRIKNRCLMTNRAYSVNRFFRISRISFRELARNASLLGVRRSSW